MIKFFKDLGRLHQFTLSLDFHQDMTQCHKCSKHDQFVSHGFVYKKQRQGDKTIVGKRIFCSNRYGKVGCGSTHRLYLTAQIPSLQYNTEHLFRFLLELIFLSKKGDDSLVFCMTQFGRSYDFNVARYVFVMIRVWQNHHKMAKCYDG